MSSATKDITLDFMIDEGEVLGATPSENLVITRVQHGTIADGHIKEGDKIVKVNDMEPHDVNHFYRLIVSASRLGHLNLVVRRVDQSKDQDVLKDAKDAVPQERLGKLRIRDGFAYKVVVMEFKRGEKVGLAIKDYMNCVVVTKAPEGTMAGRVFRVGDTICDVDNVRVTDKGVAQTLIIAALKSKREVSMLVASPESEDAKKWMSEALSAHQPPPPASPQQADCSTDRTAPRMEPTVEQPSAIVCRDPPSIRLKSDVRGVCMAEIERRRKEKDQPLQSALRQPSNPANRVTYNTKIHEEHLIVNENPNVPLRPVK